MTEDEIQAIRQGDKEKSIPPMPNYTTCIDFAGEMMRESVREMYATDFKKAAETSAMLSKGEGRLGGRLTPATLDLGDDSETAEAEEDDSDADSE